MANPEHLQMLKQDVVAWKAWRHQYRDITPDLEGADFTGGPLGEANLVQANLTEGALAGADLTEGILTHATLTHVALIPGPQRPQAGQQALGWTHTARHIMRRMADTGLLRRAQAGVYVVMEDQRHA